MCGLFLGRPAEGTMRNLKLINLLTSLKKQPTCALKNTENSTEVGSAKYENLFFRKRLIQNNKINILAVTVINKCFRLHSKLCSHSEQKQNYSMQKLSVVGETNCLMMDYYTHRITQKYIRQT
jgi:hypothetical protein